MRQRIAHQAHAPQQQEDAQHGGAQRQRQTHHEGPTHKAEFNERLKEGVPDHADLT
ncbi:hypothetical protein LNP59_10355 [Klebsiella pneumoniae subsp. pneumoniae]|nr:hypothetical protein [Klebsiella pneumoniae subsp. pneumoniae]